MGVYGDDANVNNDHEISARAIEPWNGAIDRSSCGDVNAIVNVYCNDESTRVHPDG